MKTEILDIQLREFFTAEEYVKVFNDGFSVCEDPTDTDLKEFEKRVLMEL